MLYRRLQALDKKGTEITGQIDQYETCRRENLLPLALTYDIKLKRDVPKGKPLQVQDVEIPEDLLVYQLWRLQQETFPPAACAESRAS